MLHNIFIPRVQKQEKYREWLNENYINGTWFIGKENELNDFKVDITRSISDLYFISTETRYAIGCKLHNFKKTQSINILVVSDGVEYEYTGKIFKHNYIYTLLDDEINVENISSIRLYCDETDDGYFSYSAINMNLTLNDFEAVTRLEYDAIMEN